MMGGAQGNVGVRSTFADLSATVCRHLDINWSVGTAV